MHQSRSRQAGFARPTDVFRQVSTRIPGPVGCLLRILLLPLLVLAAVFIAVFARGSVDHTRETLRRRPTTPEDVAREVALCSLVRGLALDERFSREEALGTAVLAPAGAVPPTSELLDDAVGRGWVAEDGHGCWVTREGRREAEEFLDRRNL